MMPNNINNVCIIDKLQGANKQQDFLFTGDTLFLGGCGSLFEGGGKMYVNFWQIQRHCGALSLLFPGYYGMRVYFLCLVSYVLCTAYLFDCLFNRT